MMTVSTYTWLIIRLRSRLCGLGVLLGTALGLITACGQLPLSAPAAASAPTAILLPTLKPPDTDELNSPICAYFDTTEATVSVNSDMPYPRCVNVQPNQYLRITNHLSETVRVALAGFDQQIAPNASTTFTMPFGQYLAPGIHYVSMSSYGDKAVELWLTPSREYVLNK